MQKSSRRTHFKKLCHPMKQTGIHANYFKKTARGRLSEQGCLLRLIWYGKFYSISHCIAQIWCTMTLQIKDYISIFSAIFTRETSFCDSLFCFPEQQSFTVASILIKGKNLFLREQSFSSRPLQRRGKTRNTRSDCVYQIARLTAPCPLH